jgi:hypothetical protein
MNLLTKTLLNKAESAISDFGDSMLKKGLNSLTGSLMGGRDDIGGGDSLTDSLLGKLKADKGTGGCSPVSKGGKIGSTSDPTGIMSNAFNNAIESSGLAGAANTISALGDKAGGALFDVADKADTLFGKVGGALSGIGDKAGGALFDVADKADTLFGKAGGALSGIGDKVGGALFDVADKADTLFGKAGGALFDVADKADTLTSKAKISAGSMFSSAKKTLSSFI